ncbi:hypothetical protein UCRPA7_5891 [Phaeoacremonium minimum UCRPA7]|uniref:Uncharacterized protein n=1 Tax=Phaeoacremonium minimum (strain UCR-PA7) TaxID=1286976 RepID=R8BH48_PHAM7|nr:hypothetical protein UCRPA7_5891 [Phaeoacremonium minimum UCRPA7]EON98567.1 hypothetical protein UCRPA7_5891 [Phaeoacremonium minimum UCRPA7]
MATVQRPSAAHHHNKITTARNKVVKPILKKLSHSEKNSLDLDRGWEDQQTGHGFGSLYESGSAGRSARDVSFKFPAFSEGSGGAGGGGGGGGAVGGGGGIGIGGGGIAASSTTSAGATAGAGRGSTSSDNRRKLHHGRSMSGTSGISVASNGSGHRGGSSFVHPFQQTPRTSTPPLSYANSLASFDNNRDYSPTITEHDDDDLDSLSHHIHHPHGGTHPSSKSQSSLRRPSLASQRTSSLSDITTAAPQLRVNTQRPTQAPTPSSRLLHGGVLGTSYSHSDLHLNLTSFDSPSSLTGTGIVASPSSSAAPMSPLRSSLDGMGFRLRSRSEVDTVARRDDIREARRKFEEREKIKEEKYDREQIRKQERRENRQAAAQLRKHHAASDPVRPTASRKNSPSTITTTLSGTQIIGGGAPRKSESGSVRPSGHRKSSATPDEKGLGFASSNYDAVPGGATPSFGPNVDDVHFQTPKRRSTAKKRTQSYWTGFILWLRTRLLRMGRK